MVACSADHPFPSKSPLQPPRLEPPIPKAFQWVEGCSAAPPPPRPSSAVTSQSPGTGRATQGGLASPLQPLQKVLAGLRRCLHSESADPATTSKNRSRARLPSFTCATRAPLPRSRLPKIALGGDWRAGIHARRGGRDVAVIWAAVGVLEPGTHTHTPATLARREDYLGDHSQLRGPPLQPRAHVA